MKYFLFAFVLIGFLACSDDDLSPEDQLAQDTEIIEAYLVDNNITNAIQDPSGLFYVIDEEGNGSSPTINNQVIVNYRGFFLDSGDTFDENDNIQFPLTGVIPGWQIGIPKLEVGGKGRLYVPSGLGYGPSGRGNIPGNTILGFEVELLGFQ